MPKKKLPYYDRKGYAYVYANRQPVSLKAPNGRRCKTGTPEALCASHRFSLGIENTLTELDCCIKNIVHFSKAQHRIVCLLEDTCGILETQEYNEIAQHIRSLKNSIEGLHGLSIREIKGEDCRKEYANLGFDSNRYNSKYLTI